MMTNEFWDFMFVHTVKYVLKGWNPEYIIAATTKLEVLLTYFKNQYSGLTEW